ncbi:hypothetical protein KM1_150300 [Entamoeba histolytica HM-3:IMSS]|uniref:Serine/threonine-protein phosphatase 4 regulatory subunit 3-like central domain-containing protein n=2 Tax=Entamoeba histolytica TaxID=5759 RepID=M2RUX8_ENTHI|nr:Hypothetical protein EHI5A_109840 [Entamoeba histolytica KU27]EMS11559.1 hypothetical protein KM1_150300 [Entamoeba histolytica HM-3:IMSS]
MDQSNKRQLAKVFKLNNNEWEEHGTGVFKQFINGNCVHIEITSEGKSIIKVIMGEGDAFEKQNDRVVQIQGKSFENEYALSFIDKTLCSTLCNALLQVKARKVSDSDIEKLECNETNIFQLRDLAYKAMSTRNPSELLSKINPKEIAQGLVQISKTINESTSKEFMTCVFIFVKALLFISDNQLMEELYKLSVLKSLFVILSYDPLFLSNNRPNFLEEFYSCINNMKEVIEQTETLTQLIEYSFALVYFRDVVIARFSDETVCAPITLRIDILNKKILIETINNKSIEKLLELYDSSLNQMKRGICITVKKMCYHLLLFTLPLREEYAKSMIDQGLIKIIKKGLLDDNKSFCLEALNSLFQCSTSIGLLLIKDEILQLIAKTILTSSTSFYYGAFQILIDILDVTDGNVTFEREMINTMIPSVIDILIQPLNDTSPIQLTNYNSYISHISSLVYHLSCSTAISVKPYIIQCGIFNKILQKLPTLTHSSQASVLQSLRNIIRLNNQDYTTQLLDAGMIEIVKEMIPSMSGMTLPIACEIIDSFKNRMSILPLSSSSSVPTPEVTNGVQDLAQLSLPSPLKRPVDIENTMKMMEIDSPSKRRVMTPIFSQ